MELNRWRNVGLAGIWAPRRAVKLNYYLESLTDDRGIVRYRVRDMNTGAIAPLAGNNGRSIVNFVSFSKNPERKYSSFYPMKSYPYVLSILNPTWYYVTLFKK